ncbi:MAG TPA: FixH family protein, partial [Candidatus Eisenbacteria bacterium]|nr:FixH family protein [Candidatus Eisenbacteria bacterium]
MKAAVVIAALLLSACGAEAAPTPAATSSQLQAQVVATEIVVGSQQRVPIGITDHNTPVSDATVHVRSFVLNGNTGVFKGESDAPFKGQGLEGGGTYIAHLTFDKAGDWGVEVTASRPNGSHTTVRLPMNVIALPVVPGVGQPAPATHNPTVKDVADVETIDSGRPPNDMHQLSIAEAIQQHRPALVVFATPAFCVSRTCGPQVKVVQSLEPTYRDRLTFIHIEIYRDFKPDPSKKQLAQAVVDWRLQTEPWIFLIDSKGIIQSR